MAAAVPALFKAAPASESDSKSTPDPKAITVPLAREFSALLDAEKEIVTTAAAKIETAETAAAGLAAEAPYAAAREEFVAMTQAEAEAKVTAAALLRAAAANRNATAHAQAMAQAVTRPPPGEETAGRFANALIAAAKAAAVCREQLEKQKSALAVASATRDKVTEIAGLCKALRETREKIAEVEPKLEPALQAAVAVGNAADVAKTMQQMLQQASDTTSSLAMRVRYARPQDTLRPLAPEAMQLARDSGAWNEATFAGAADAKREKAHAAEAASKAAARAASKARSGGFAAADKERRAADAAEAAAATAAAELAAAQEA